MILILAWLTFACAYTDEYGAECIVFQATHGQGARQLHVCSATDPG